MDNNYIEQTFNNRDEQSLISAVMKSTFFKEHLRKAWSNGRRFDIEQYKKRNVDSDFKEIPDNALKFEEWFSKHYT